MSNPYETGKDKSSSVLGPTLSFKGVLKADEDLLVQGKIEGSIHHTSNLKIGKDGQIKAEVNAEYIEVHGKVKGNLTGTKSVVVKDSANVSGNIFSPTVSLHEGSKFNGSIDMTGKQPAAKPEKAAEETTKETAEKTTEKPVKSEKKQGANAKRASNAA